MHRFFPLFRRLRLLPFLCVLALAGCGSAPQEDLELKRLNNRGVALMGRFDYPAAADTFAELFAAAPDWPLARVNLAVATLNRQNPGDEEAALALLEPLLELAGPEQARANFMAGILHFNQGSTERALTLFRRAAGLVPDDAYASYFLGQTLLQSGEVEAALAQFELAGSLDGYLRSAFYGQFLARQRLGQRQQAADALAVYERLEDNPQSRLAEIKYTRMGPLAMAIAVAPEGAPPRPRKPPAGALFGEPVALAETLPVSHASVLTQPSDSGLAVTLTVAGEDALFECSLAQCRGFDAPLQQVVATAWGDMDSNGAADRLLLGPAGIWIEQRAAASRWTAVLPDDPLVSRGGWEDLAVFDADHDGDLDILLTGSARPGLLISNNGDGSYRRLDEYMPALIAARQAVVADLDRDRDLDLVLVGLEGQQVLLNDRLWRYRESPAALAPWQSEKLVGLALADLDVDGRLEALALAGDELTVWREGDEGWAKGQVVSHGVADADLLLLEDFSGNGQPELLIGGADSWRVLEPATGRALTSGTGRVLAPLVTTVSQGPGILLTQDGKLAMLPPGAGRYPFATLSLSGLTDPGQSMRSNASGLGARIVARGPAHWQALSSPAQFSGPGQSLQPLSAGLGGAGALEAVTLDWSDGVFQTELDLGPGLHEITETQRQLASCPVLFQWDGQEYRFVTDVLGVGGMGFNLGFGEYAKPRPWEKLLLDYPENPAGTLRLLIAEPMEEIAYIDQVSVEALEFPVGLELRLDERMATDQEQASGALLWVETMVRPVAATDHRGVDVRTAILTPDLKAAPVPPVEPRLTGLLVRPQVLTLEFDRDLAALNQPLLVFDGWVEYGYSQTLFSAWQQNRVYDAVSLDVFRNGAWESWRPSFGYPAGMPREATLPLTGLPVGVTRLRLRTNQQIYFDQLAVAQTVVAPAHVRTPLHLASARVRQPGFARRTNGPQMQPSYDFSRRDTFWDTRYQRGHYTALGPATELVSARDNALAIIGPGDALELEFELDLAPPAPGTQRRLLVTFHGWAKDMDLYTEHGETVAPLPARAGLAADRSSELHARYNTRFRSGR